MMAIEDGFENGVERQFQDPSAKCIGTVIPLHLYF